jgi:hypothetical protein
VFTLDEIIPWGRSFQEYRRMFALSEADLSSRILGCADGPASFNAEATQRGTKVISVDPLYAFGGDIIRDRIASTYEQILEKTRSNLDLFVWDTIPSMEELGRLRASAMQLFLDDYECGKLEGCYVDGALPLIPFPDKSFDLVHCSRFLFLYTDNLPESFHRRRFMKCAAWLTKYESSRC